VLPGFAGGAKAQAAVLRSGDACARPQKRTCGEFCKNKDNLQAATLDTNSAADCSTWETWKESISQFRSAISRAPTFAPAHFHLGEAPERKGESSEAQKQFQRSAELEPRFQPATP
jgi:tetratricopeptide (TPR) repeat protein